MNGVERAGWAAAWLWSRTGMARVKDGVLLMTQGGRTHLGQASTCALDDTPGVPLKNAVVVVAMSTHRPCLARSEELENALCRLRV